MVTVWEEDILEVVPTKDESASCISTSVTEITEALKTIDVGNVVESEQTDEHTNNTTHVEPTEIEPSTKLTTIQNDTENSSFDASKIFTGNIPIDTDQGYKYLKRWKRRKLCAFCNDDDDTSEELGQFIGPFVIATFNKNGVEKKRSFWAHDSCARYSPEVFCTPEGKWYNVTLALRRGRGMVKFTHVYNRLTLLIVFL